MLTSDCPPDAAPGYTAEDVFFHRDTVKYLTEIIDGQVALWNWKEVRATPLPIHDGPAWDDIRNVSIPTNSMTWAQVAKKYGTCLGVVVQIVTTKSGNWQPSQSR